MPNDDGSGLIFIVGHYKSGSTWLVNLLSLHPDVRGVGETSIFPYVTHHDDVRVITRKVFHEGFWGRGGLPRQIRHRLAEWARPVRGYWKPTLPARDRPTVLMDLGIHDQRLLRRSLLQSTSKEDYCRRFFGFLHQVLRPRAYLVEKNNNIGLVPFIKKIFPGAKLMAIYRDGRDVVVSEKFFLRNEEGRAKTFQDSVLGWRRAMEQQFRFEQEYGILTVSYESLLADGEAVVGELLRSVDLPDDPAIVADMVRRSSFQFITGRQSGSENARSFFRKGMSGDWRNHFTDREKNTFNELAGDVLTRLHYERDPAW